MAVESKKFREVTGLCFISQSTRLLHVQALNLTAKSYKETLQRKDILSLTGSSEVFCGDDCNFLPALSSVQVAQTASNVGQLSLTSMVVSLTAHQHTSSITSHLLNQNDLFPSVIQIKIQKLTPEDTAVSIQTKYHLVTGHISAKIII